jgi:DNA mismatch endonuclease (patch repair protein)
MADVFSKQKRSEVMAMVRGTNTRPELLVRKFLFSQRLRFRLHDKTLPGKPDIKLPNHRCLIFVHGCFWHLKK